MSRHNSMDLRTAPVDTLVRRLALPAGTGMMFATLMSVTDTWYAGRLSSTALAALSLAAPLFFLVVTFGIGIAQATNALVGNALGADEEQQARHMAAEIISYTIGFSVIVAVVSYLFVPDLFQLMGGQSPYLQPAVGYMRVVLVGTVLFALSMVFNSILNTRGDTTSYLYAQVAAAVANVALDPLFMFGLGLGVTGVALATICVQAGVAAYLLWRVRRLDFMASLGLRELKPDPGCYGVIFRQSLPNILSMMLIALGSIIIVRFVALFGESAMAAYGVALRIEQLLLLPVIGINIACLSLTSVNNGAGLQARVREIWHSGLKHGVALMAFAGVILLLGARLFMQWFSNDAEVQAIGRTYLYIEAFILPAYALIFISNAVMQGLKRPDVAMYLNAIRQIVGQLLLFWLAVQVLGLGLNGIWWSVLAINWLMAGVALLIIRKRYIPAAVKQEDAA